MNNVLKRLATVVAALALLVYVGYQAYQMLFSSIQTETVYAYSEYKTVDTQGLVIRSETPVTASKTSGYVYYSVTNGERVAKGGKIASVYKNEEDALAYRQLQQLDAEIADLKTINTQGTANRVNLELINKQMSYQMSELVQAAHAPRTGDLRDAHTELLSLMNKQQITTGKVSGFSDYISSLQKQRNSLSSSHAGAQSAITSPVAGYFVSEVDGYEQTLDYTKATTMQVADIQKALAEKPKVDSSQYLGKVVGDYEWHMTCVVPESDAVHLRNGTSLTVLMPFVSDEAIPMEVVATNSDKKGSVAVIFKCAQMSEVLSSVRSETVQIQIERYEGLRVPKNALVFDKNNEAGVYVRVGNTATFRKVEILYSAAEYSICKSSSESGSLKLYDDIIVGGKGLYDGKIIR